MVIFGFVNFWATKNMKLTILENQKIFTLKGETAVEFKH